jgi:hypothetical protein
VRDAALDRLDPFVAEIGSAAWDGHWCSPTASWSGLCRRLM